jgi:hypothetical protein
VLRAAGGGCGCKYQHQTIRSKGIGKGNSVRYTRAGIWYYLISHIRYDLESREGLVALVEVERRNAGAEGGVTWAGVA